MADKPTELFEQYPVCQWQAKGKPAIAFPVEKIQETYVNRLAKHKRVYRDGFRLDDTGADGRIFEITSGFFNGHNEPGLKGDELYPDVLNELCESFKIHETGTLTTPTRGEVRCRLESYRRVEGFEDRDMAALVFTFVEDNEDDAKASSFQAPSARSVSRRLAEKTVESAEEMGSFNDMMGEIEDFASDLEGMANGPADFVNDIDAKANAIANRCEAVEEAFSDTTAKAANELSTLLKDPRNAAPIRGLRRLADIVKKAPVDKVASQPTIIPKVYSHDVSIFDVSVDVGQSPDKLLPLNPKLEDPLNIPGGTPIQVYESS
jgi:prophage DNA circulation protein